MLGRKQIWTVDRKQRIAGMYRFANGTSKDLFDVTRNLAMDVSKVSFVVGHLADDSNLFGESSDLSRYRMHPDQLLLLGRHEDRSTCAVAFGLGVGDELVLAISGMGVWAMTVPPTGGCRMKPK